MGKAQYYETENRTTPPIATQEQRFLRYGQEYSQTNIDMQTWNYPDCAFTCNDTTATSVNPHRQYFDVVDL